MTEQNLIEKLNTNGLGKYFDELKPHLRNTIQFYLTSCNESELQIGQSKIGGQPDLPENIPWVTETETITISEKKFIFFTKETKQTKTKSLSFIAQINLTEIANLDSENLLPKNGILYFFYSGEQEVWGFDYKDKDKFKVLFYDGKFSKLKRAEFPNDLKEYSKFKPCKVTAKQELSLPSYNNDIYDIFDEEESDIFYDQVYEDKNINKALGYSDNIQNDMELQCELVTNGLYCGDPSGYNDPRAKALESNAKNWRLLLQIDSNENCKMMWGDAGRLYFWIKIDDLKYKRFDNAWFSLQCC